LLPRKCTYAKVIDLRIMVLWSIGFIANRHRTPHQISLCPLLFRWPVPCCKQQTGIFPLLSGR